MEGFGCWLGSGLLEAGWLSMLLVLVLAVAFSMVLLLLDFAVPLVCMVLSLPVWENCDHTAGSVWCPEGMLVLVGLGSSWMPRSH
jgi:hypothetical protein